MEQVKQEFRRLMAERRTIAIGSPDHEYRTRAARCLVWVLRGVPVTEWVQ